MTGEATPAQIGGFLIGLRMKGETVTEIAAAATVMRELAAKVEVDCDGLVGFTDLLIVLNAWGPCPEPPVRCPADLDHDGDVDFDDLLILLSNWS